MALPSIDIAWRRGDDPRGLREREWLVTNGLGGYASGSLLGIPTRRYHGVFVPSLPHPKGRHVMISHLDEEIVAGGQAARMGGAEYPDGRLESDCHRHLLHFRLARLLPTWVFEVGGSVVEKTVTMLYGQNTMCVQYRLLEGGTARLHVRLHVSFRRIDADLVAESARPFTLGITRRRHTLQLADSDLELRVAMRPDRGVFVAHETESPDVLYRVERDRGYTPCVEDLYSPGYFAIDLVPDQPATFVASTQGWESIDGVDGAGAINAECERVDRFVALALPAAREGFGAALAQAADQFIVLPGTRVEEAVIAEASGHHVRTIIAGYHWFGDWGRDTMIGLEGLALVTGRHREAGAILRTFARYVRDGLLPNLFPEGERHALYHTADATFWFFHAIDRYVAASGDEDILRELHPVLADIIERHVRGTHFGIGVDPRDGLVSAGAPGYQLTWMDAKVDDWVVTPRRGKPVEIQALWHNALMLMAEWSARIGAPDGAYRARAEEVRAAFNARFWQPRLGYLLDVVDGEHGDDPSCRPNQIFAVSLHHPVLQSDHWGAVVDTVGARLLTPFGLRTLAPDHPDYKRSYHGDLRARDAAYHQGTVWPWLIGHFVDAWLRVHGDPARARGMLEGFRGHLHDAGIGSISEIFDAEPPFVPRGCIAQAWSVAEVLRAWVRTDPRAAAPDQTGLATIR
jgi:predicted glycogen debranching enzyme